MHDKCSARSKHSGVQCGNWPMRGGKVCRMHGGASPTARAKARRVLVEREIRARFHDLDSEAITDPFRALQEVAGELVVFKDRLRYLIEEMDGWTGYDDKSMEYGRALVVLYQNALRDTVNGLALIARLNIDERLAVIEEAKAAMVIKAIDAALTDAGIVGPAAEQARAVAGRHLRLVS